MEKSPILLKWEEKTKIVASFLEVLEYNVLMFTFERIPPAQEEVRAFSNSLLIATLQELVTKDDDISLVVLEQIRLNLDLIEKALNTDTEKPLLDIIYSVLVSNSHYNQRRIFSCASYELYSYDEHHKLTCGTWFDEFASNYHHQYKSEVRIPVMA